MKIRRVLPWLGWVLTAVAAAVLLGFWYLSAQRLQLDQENRRELSHVAHDLKSILDATTESATNFFKDPKTVTDFAKRNPYVLPKKIDDTPFAITSTSCSVAVNDSLQLSVREGARERTIDLDLAKIFDDVVIDEAFEYLFIAESGRDKDKPEANVVFAMAHGEASRHQGGLGWVDRHSREASDR